MHVAAPLVLHLRLDLFGEIRAPLAFYQPEREVYARGNAARCYEVAIVHDSGIHDFGAALA
jgi:hypothetical protein